MYLGLFLLFPVLQAFRPIPTARPESAYSQNTSSRKPSWTTLSTNLQLLWTPNDLVSQGAFSTVFCSLKAKRSSSYASP